MLNILSHQGKHIKTVWRCHSSNNDSHNECKEQNIIIKPILYDEYNYNDSFQSTR